MRRFGSYLFTALCLAFTAGALINVMADNREVEQMAKATACGDQGPSCNTQLTRMQRNPFAQTFDLTTPKRTVTVSCTRSLYLFGSYSCAVR
jgi:hypothetical protein